MEEKKIFTVGSQKLKEFLKSHDDLSNGYSGDTECLYYYLKNKEIHTQLNRIVLKKDGYKEVPVSVFIDYLKEITEEKIIKKDTNEFKKSILSTDANIQIQALDEIIQDLEARLDSAYKEQEEMLKELDRNIDMMKYHCEQIKINTGEMSMGDIYYCANMITRIMKHKFGYKPQMQEM